MATLSCCLRHFFAGKLPHFLRGSALSQIGRIESIASMRKNVHLSYVDVSDAECEELLIDVKSKRDAALHMAVAQLAGEFGKESMLSLRRFFSSRHAPVISTGSLKLDLALGIGGLPKGRIVEIYGQEASGKSMLALHIIKEAQSHGGYCVYLDAENAMDPSLAESVGVNTQNLLISPPDSAERLLSMVDQLARSGSVDVIVIDSVAALVPQHEIDAPIERIHEETQSRIMMQALRRIHQSLSHSETLVVFLNQIRTSMRSGQPSEVTCGGNALRFYSAVRLRMIRRRLHRTGSLVTGIGVGVQVVKNKLAASMKTAELGIQFGRGFCCEPDAFELAVEHGIILEDRNGFLLDGHVFDDQQSAILHLSHNKQLLHQIVTQIRQHLF